MPTITNIAAYKFASLKDLKPLREHLLRQCKSWGLKGTILLSTEGINLFIAGAREKVDALLTELRTIPGLEALTAKYSESEDQPFTRMLVRIKKEIIAFGVEGIDPVGRPAPKLAPRDLKRWLDEGRPVTLLDTRNDYEVRLGTFKNAVTLPIDHFREFPEAVAALPAEMKSQPIVMFCTGGIRCEKAGPFMQREGYQNIYQLEGGILKYFEDCGGDHYDGECFVFDQRVGVDACLHESQTGLCYACLAPLTPEEQADPRFVQGESCPYCYRTTTDQMAISIAAREEAIRAATTPLPGSQPYDNLRPLLIPASYHGQSLLAFLCGVFPHVPQEEWISICQQQRILNSHHQPVTAEQTVQGGERYLHLLPATQEPDVNVDIKVLYEDEAIIVLHKPAPLPMHPSGRFNRNTLQHILCTVYHPQAPRPAHRLDANTTGLVIFARTKHFAKRMQPQFARGEVAKVYLARVQGHPAEDSFSCDAPLSDSAGEIGSRGIDEENGLPSLTHFKVLQRFADGTSLLEVRPETGRTNQIRVHLWQLGFPICGDQTYLPNKTLGDTQTHTTDDSPLCLLAHSLRFKHPQTQQPMEFKTALPTWAEAANLV